MADFKFKYWKLEKHAMYGTANLAECLGKLTETNGCTVILCTSGYAIVSINQKRYRLSAGNFLFLPFDMAFIPISTSKNFNVRYISVSMEIIDETVYTIPTGFWDFIYARPVLETTAVQLKSLQNWLGQTEWLIDNCNEEFMDDTLKNCFFNLLVGTFSEIKRLGSDEWVSSYIKNRSWKLLSQFYALLNRYHYKHRSVKFYADKMSITSDYLYKLVYRMDGISPKEVIDRQLIITLKTYLQYTDLSIKNIANELNFEDASYMCRFFRKMTGLSPNQFRNQKIHE